MTFWLIAGALILVTLVILLLPLLRRAKVPVERAQHDMAVYRDQLAEVERDLARGVVNPEEAEGARQEVKRRLLTADSAEAPDQTAERQSGNLVLLIALCVLVPAATVGLYLGLGNPGQPSVPFAERPAPDAPPVEMVQAVEQLAARLAQDPSDPEGWQLLGRSYAQMGRFRAAAEAFRQAIAQGDDSANAYASLGEMLTASRNGDMGPDARQAFAAALGRDPANPRARYYAGLAYAQDGLLAQALQVWQELERGQSGRGVLAFAARAADRRLARRTRPPGCRPARSRRAGTKRARRCRGSPNVARRAGRVHRVHGRTPGKSPRGDARRSGRLAAFGWCLRRARTARRGFGGTRPCHGAGGQFAERCA